MSKLYAEITSFKSFPDASGAPTLIVVRYGKQAAHFALDIVGNIESPACNGLGSGLSPQLTHRAAELARSTFRAEIKAKLGSDWIIANKKLYTEA